MAKREEAYLFSKNFKDNWQNYLWQSVAAGIVTIVVLYIFYELIALIILAGVGSTFFTVFALPNYRTARARNVIGSYIISVLVGLPCYYLSPLYLSGGIAVGATAFLMVITDTEHPPAAGIALGLAISALLEYALAGAVFAVIGALLSSLLRHLLAPWLKDLV